MKMPSIDEIVRKIKSSPDSENVGMILIHNGIVRKSSKNEERDVKNMILSYDEKLLKEKIDKLKQENGIVDVFAIINKGKLNIGDDIMIIAVAGDRRSNILKPFEDFIEFVKHDIVKETEIYE